MKEDIIQSAVLRERYGIPGETLQESNILMDKYFTKAYLHQANVKCAEYVHFQQMEKEEIKTSVQEVKAKLAYPMFGKPANLNTSRCTAEIHNQRQLRDYFVYTIKFPELRFMIEEFLEGKWKESTIRSRESSMTIKNAKCDGRCSGLLHAMLLPCKNGTGMQLMLPRT